MKKNMCEQIKLFKILANRKVGNIKNGEGKRGFLFVSIDEELFIKLVNIYRFQ